MLLLLLWGCVAEIPEPEPVVTPDRMAVEVADCILGDFTEFALGTAEAVAAYQCEAENDSCHPVVYDRQDDGTVRVACTDQYEYVRLTVIYPGSDGMAR